MNCEAAQSQILESHYDAELEAHVAAGEACREFSRALLTFGKPITPPPLPAKLHDQILRSSDALIRAHLGARTRAQRPSVQWQPHGFVLAVIMILYFAGLALLLGQFSFEAMWWRIAAIFVGQNLLALLFSPLLFTRVHLLQTGRA